jgi:hypothetical protein
VIEHDHLDIGFSRHAADNIGGRVGFNDMTSDALLVFGGLGHRTLVAKHLYHA